MNSFYAVVVVYNSEVTESQTCTNIEQISGHNVNLIVVDNSTKDNSNKAICADKGWKYISMNGNAGLSKAYNKVLCILEGEEGIIIWFDDDTNVTQDYFDMLEKAVDEHQECDVFTPLIQGQDGRFWSPNEYRFFRNKQLKEISQQISDDRFNAINSCTAVRLGVYKNYRYDERLFLDQVDHSFFESQREEHRKFLKLDVLIQHNFSTKSKMQDLNAVKNRYSIMIPDFLTFCSRDKKKYLLGLVKVCGWGIRESIKYKEPTFIAWCMSEAFKHHTNAK